MAYGEQQNYGETDEKLSDSQNLNEALEAEWMKEEIKEWYEKIDKWLESSKIDLDELKKINEERIAAGKEPLPNLEKAQELYAEIEREHNSSDIEK